MELDFTPYYYIIPGLLVGIAIGWRIFGASAKLKALEKDRATTKAALDAARTEISELKRNLASARDQIKPLADEVDRLTKEKAARKASLNPEPSTATKPAEPAPVAPTSAMPWEPGRKLPTFMDAPNGPTDDLTLLKGVGPRLAAALREIGIYYFAQIADWTPDETKLVDAKLDTFRGRIEKDKMIEQAKLIAAGRMTEYEARFGKLGGN